VLIPALRIRAQNCRHGQFKPFTTKTPRSDSECRDRPMTAKVWRPWIGSTICSEDRSGELYLIEHLQLDALKIGVASDDSSRIANHENRGWQLVDSWWFPHLTDAYVIEELILDRWRNLYQTLPHVPREQMPQKGFTETMARSSDAVHEIRRFVRAQCEERLVPVSAEAWLMQGLQPVVSSERFSSWQLEDDDEAA